MALDAARYRIGAAIAGDALSRVVEADHPDLAVPVVLKIWSGDLPREAYDDGAQEARARALGEIAAPQLVRALDWGYLGQSPYVAMEHVEGQPLGRDAALALDSLIDVTRALAAMHAAGLVHGALRPTSVLVTWQASGGGPYRAGERTRARLLGALGRPPLRGMWLGPGAMPPFSNLFYLAPEQVKGQAVDQRADLYAVGVMLHEAVCGAVPLPMKPGDSFLGYMARRLEEKPVPPARAAAARGRTLTPAIEQILVKALQPDRERRFLTAAELGRALTGARDEPGHK